MSKADQGHRSVRCRQLGRAPLRLTPLGFARGFGKTGQAFSKSARRGAPPVVSCQHSNKPALFLRPSSQYRTSEIRDSEVASHSFLRYLTQRFGIVLLIPSNYLSSKIIASH